jgi:ubiquinone/menaquinone biosynthesis C-methylase UbiE
LETVERGDALMPLTRILEPEVMDTAQEAAEYDAMDHTEVNRRFVDDLLSAGDVTGDVLDLGTGTALIPVELCRRTEDCRIMAVDLSVAMLDLARYNIEAAGYAARIELRHVDAKRLPYDAMFDLVMSNSIVHHIPEPIAVLRDAVRAVRPAGRIFFRDLLRPADDRRVRELVDTYAGDATEHQRRMFEASLRAALSLDEIRDLVSQLGIDPLTVQATSDRHWTWQVGQQGG